MEKDLDSRSTQLWEQFCGALARQGVAPAIAEYLQLSLDPDGKDERRGWAYHADAIRTLFLKDDADIAEILRSALICAEPQTWSRYPGWYGAQMQQWVRRNASRFIPLRSENDPLLRSLLDDADSIVRFIAAVRLSMTTPKADDDDLLRVLSEAIASDAWNWSFGDTYRSGRYGNHETVLHLARFGPRAAACAPHVARMIDAAKEEATQPVGWLAEEWRDWALKADGVLATIRP